MVYKKFRFKRGSTIFLLLGILSGSLPSLFTLLNFQSWNWWSLYTYISPRKKFQTISVKLRYESTFPILGYTTKKSPPFVRSFKFLIDFLPFPKNFQNATSVSSYDYRLTTPSNHRIQYRFPIRRALRRIKTQQPISEISGVVESNTVDDGRPNRGGIDTAGHRVA